MSAIHERRLKLHLVAEQFRTPNVKRSLTRFKRKPFGPDCRLPLNLKKLVGGLVSLGFRVEDIGAEFDLDPHTVKRLWLAFGKMDPETQVLVFRDAFARRACVQNRRA